MANEKKALIEALQDAMKKRGLAAYLIPSADPHQSEYVAAYWKTRAHFSGFTGSAGILVVTSDQAGLWTDSRYFLQAEAELKGSGISLCKQVIPHAPEHIPWLAEQLPEKSVVGINGRLFTIGQVEYMKTVFRTKRIKIESDLQLEDEIWQGNRPPLPTSKVFELAPEVAGETRLQKLNRIAQELKKRNAGFQLVSTLDDIAWILNIRSGDVAYNPVCISYLMVGHILSYLFVDTKKIPSDLQEKLQVDGILLKPYEEIVPFLAGLGSKQNVLCDQNTVSIGLFEAIPNRKRLLGPNFSRRFKAIKNDTEVNLIRRAMIKDGVALTKLYRWLIQHLQSNSTTEVEVRKKLDQFRQAEGSYYGESFPAIVGYKGNGAIIHYHAEKGNCATITAEGILLLDSGGQYLQGTTDITRTTTLGTPTAAQKRHFTLVLKGHIALSNIEFPKGTTGVQLDALARQFLWRAGLNYGHGTGHGVGFFLNVHEPPQGFATTTTTARGSTAFEAGMLTSNEPGYYLEGSYGIRIENLMLCIPSKNKKAKDFLAFEALTLFPIDQQLIDLELLEPLEIQWLNSYHQKVLEQLSPHLDLEEIQWLKQQCQEIPMK
ncbi:MAG: aminopeptidase P family protein [Saprospiraceae bacterium]|nr:aminopeptidase P family protein [Saprospiraceae bacterium]